MSLKHTAYSGNQPTRLGVVKLTASTSTTTIAIIRTHGAHSSLLPPPSRQPCRHHSLGASPIHASSRCLNIDRGAQARACMRGTRASVRINPVQVCTIYVHMYGQQCHPRPAAGFGMLAKRTRSCKTHPPHSPTSGFI